MSGASVAGVAQAHRLNANLVRQWLVGRGVKRCSGVEQRAASVPIAADAAPMTEASRAMPFVPVQPPAPVAATTPRENAGEPDESIHIELTRSGAKLTVRWPVAQASACASWPGELAGVLSL